AGARRGSRTSKIATRRMMMPIRAAICKVSGGMIGCSEAIEELTGYIHQRSPRGEGESLRGPNFGLAGKGRLRDADFAQLAKRCTMLAVAFGASIPTADLSLKS